MLLSTAEDAQVILVKLAERLHNTRFVQPLRIVLRTVLLAGLTGTPVEEVAAQAWRADDYPPSVAVAVQGRARAARPGSTLGAALVSGGASLVVPGLGLAGLLVVKSAAAKATLAHRTL